MFSKNNRAHQKKKKTIVFKFFLINSFRRCCRANQSVTAGSREGMTKTYVEVMVSQCVEQRQATACHHRFCQFTFFTMMWSSPLQTHTHTGKFVGTYPAACTRPHIHTHIPKQPQWINYSRSQCVCVYGLLIGSDRGCGDVLITPGFLAFPHRPCWHPPITHFSLTFLSL